MFFTQVGDSECGDDLPCPIGSTFQLAFEQRAFRIADVEPFRRNDQLSALFLQPIGDGLGGVAKNLDKECQDADLFYGALRKPRIKGSDLDPL